MAVAEAHEMSVGRRVRRWPVGLVVVAIGSVAVWWMTHPSGPFVVGGSGTAHAKRDVAQISVPVFTSERPVTILSVRGVRRSATRLDVAFFGCRLRDGGFLMTAEVRGRVCEEVRSVEGLRVDRSVRGGWVVAAEVTPRGSGAAVVDRFEVLFRDGVRFGRQVLGSRVLTVVAE